MIDTFRKMTKKRMIIFLLFLMFTVIWAFAIFGFSSSTADESSEQSGKITDMIIRFFEPDYDDLPETERLNVFWKWQRIVRKTAHFCAFALLGFLTYFCVGSIKNLPHGLFVQAAVSLPFCVLFAISDEIHQIFVDGRSGQLRDVGIDSCGAAAGTLFAILLSFVYRWHIRKVRK